MTAVHPRRARAAVRGVVSRAAQRATRPHGDSVFFNSFDGAYSDNPRALSEALGRANPALEKVWMASKGHTFPVPGTTPVDMGSWGYLRRIGRAGAVVSNTYMPANFVKRPGVTYLQTWHGTPLKRIGLDNPQWDRTSS